MQFGKLNRSVRGGKQHDCWKRRKILSTVADKREGRSEVTRLGGSTVEKKGNKGRIYGST